MNRIQTRRPKFWLPSDYAKSFRQGQQSVKQAATGASSPQPRHSDSAASSTFSPSPASSPSTTSSPSSISLTSPTSSTSSNPGPVEKRPILERCSYKSTDGRQCRMFRSSGHPDLCDHHAQKELRALDRVLPDPVAAQVLGPVRDFRTAAAINSALGNLFVELADGRIDPRRAAVLGYLAQLLHQTLKRVAWEQIERKPTANLQAALSAVLKAAKPATREAKRTHQALSAVVLSHDPAHKE
jgi:hypothetical protein